MLAKSGHVATVVATVNSFVKAELVLTFQCLYQWDEGFECSLPQPSNFAKVDRQDSIGPGLNCGAPSSFKLQASSPHWGITLVTKDEWSAWTGGKPNHTWTGLDGSIALLEHTSPNQLRPVYVSAAQKGYNFRRTGHKISFKPSDDLISFQNVVWDHLKDTGMDSIAYLRDPTDDAKMTNVIKAHARYTVQSAKLLAEAQVQRYDKYDRTNDGSQDLFACFTLY
ncbi:hypothetical protein MHU86_4658 [Fragilaria crotonensis]|nr:hypothetical protein MHU86_4658 [Fragilaria crotonensis]